MNSKRFVNCLVIVALALSTMAMTRSPTAIAQAGSPFVGDWRAIDRSDGSDIRVSIGGPPAGPFRITWTESSFGGCERKAGLVQGTGSLHPDDPYVLQADLHFECFTVEREADFQMTWVYHPDLDALLSQDEEGYVTIWTRPSESMFSPRYPRFVASIEGDWFWTTDFLPSALLSISIFESQGGSPLWEGTKPADESGFVAVEPGDHAQNLEPGNYLVVNDGFTEKGLLLEPVTIHVFDLEEGRMEGNAPAGRYVYVVAADSPDAADQIVIETTADGTGQWIADFDVPFTDDWRPWSFAQIFDEDGDANEAGTPPLVGTGDLYAVPDENRIWANAWIAGGEISLTIFTPDGSEVYTESRVVPLPDETPWTQVLFGSGFALEPGQRIMISQGDYQRELIVSSIHVTGFDLGALTIFGMGDPGAEFLVGIEGVDVWGTVGDDGTWAVQNENLTGGVWGSAIQLDEDGDSTRDIFAAPNPNSYAVPDENRIWANEWIEGGEVSLTIFDLDGEPAYSETRVVPPPSANPWTEVLFESGFVLEPGQRIVIDQGGYVRELIVSSIRVTGFDLGTQMIFGTGDPGAEFFVGIGGVEVWGTVGGDGTWSVQHGELAGGVWGDAIQPDGDGDATRDGFQAPTS